MRVEICSAKNKARALPKDSSNALTQELTKRLSTHYEYIEMIVKTASNDGLSIVWLRKKGIRHMYRKCHKKRWKAQMTGLQDD